MRPAGCSRASRRARDAELAPRRLDYGIVDLSWEFPRPCRLEHLRGRIVFPDLPLGNERARVVSRGTCVALAGGQGDFCMKSLARRVVTIALIAVAAVGACSQAG